MAERHKRRFAGDQVFTAKWEMCLKENDIFMGTTSRDNLEL